MKKIDLGQSVQVLANIGVLIGIVFLVLELNQNSMMMRGQTRNDVSSQYVELMRGLADSPGLLELRIRADSGEPLSPLDSSRLAHLDVAVIRYYENVFYQYQQGLYDEAEYLAFRNIWSEWESGTRNTFWCSYRTSVSPAFVREFESVNTRIECD